jgi:hypothetical protein
VNDGSKTNGNLHVEHCSAQLLGELFVGDERQEVWVKTLAVRLWLNPLSLCSFFVVFVGTPIDQNISDLLHVAGNVAIFAKTSALSKTENAKVISHYFFRPPQKTCKDAKIATLCTS